MGGSEYAGWSEPGGCATDLNMNDGICRSSAGTGDVMTSGEGRDGKVKWRTEKSR